VSHSSDQEPTEEYHIEFDLEGIPTPVIKYEYLAHLERHLKFEAILRYVALPVLAVEPQLARHGRWAYLHKPL
jgi:hypothetical protein